MIIRKEKRRMASKVIEVITIIILVITLCYVYNFYQSNNFNEYSRSELNLKTSEFKRDNNVKYSNNKSYRIVSNNFNDAMFSKKIKVTPNTPYKITCMVKTENIIPENSKKGVGAQIATTNTNERSIAITGTNDWQKIELIFNSKNRTEVDIGFRLGGYLGACTGTAWFSDFTIEEGIIDSSNEWNFACFIYKTTDVSLDGKEIKIDVNKQEVDDIKSTIDRFRSKGISLSRGKMSVKCDIFNVNTPITSLSYDQTYGYYVAPEDVEEQIKDTIQGSSYDHIFIILKLGDEKHQNDIEVNDWIGLGSMDYYGVGFSNIRLPNDTQNYIYKYDTRINTFPEEVFLHEFLHSLERTSKEYGYEIPELHAYKEYGYENEKLIGQQKWYKDYMNKEINDGKGNKIGLPEEVYSLKPAKSSNFEYTYKKDEFKQPENIIEEIKELFNNIGNKIQLVFSNQKE